MLTVKKSFEKNKVIMKIFSNFEIYINYNIHDSLLFGIKVYIEQ